MDEKKEYKITHPDHIFYVDNWMTLGFTTSNGKTVIYAIIFVSQNLIIEERCGIDISVPLPTETNVMLNKYV